SRGYTFVSLPEFLGVDAKQVMPSDHTTAFMRTMHGAALSTYATSAGVIPLMISLLIGLSLLRILSLLTLRTLVLRTHVQPWKRGVSVLIPAYNEAQNIE